MRDPSLRPSARALLVDADGCILLAEFVLPHMRLWATPGGGIEPGETSREALERELVEEVGLVLADDPPLVWRRTVVVEGIVEGYDGVLEDFYLVPVERFDPRGELTDEQLRAENVVSFRWWSPAEIQAATSSKAGYFSPRYLGDLLVDLHRDGPPAVPHELGL
ncbi:MAG: NUDIX domain-containing protein [Aquihabitans sp.]